MSYYYQSLTFIYARNFLNRAVHRLQTFVFERARPTTIISVAPAAAAKDTGSQRPKRQTHQVGPASWLGGVTRGYAFLIGFRTLSDVDKQNLSLETPLTHSNR